MSDNVINRFKQFLRESNIAKGVIRGIIIIILILSVTIITQLVSPEDTFLFALILSTIVAIIYSIINIWYVMYRNKKE